MGVLCKVKEQKQFKLKKNDTASSKQTNNQIINPGD
jgi:hypothetical protein